MRRATKMVTALVALGCRMCLWAIEAEVVDGTEWRYGHSDNGDVVVCAVSRSKIGTVAIPAKLGGKPVRHIGVGAFKNHQGLAAVEIPDGVTSIGYDAFAGCSNLTQVTIPSSVRHVGRRAFADCGKELYDTETIPGVKLVGRWAVGPDGAVSGLLDLSGAAGIAEDAFFGCKGLTHVTFSDDAKTIGDKAFEGCAGLTFVDIPASVTFIGRSAFYGCGNLMEVSVAADNPRYFVEDGCLCDLNTGKKCKIGPYLYLPAEDAWCEANVKQGISYDDFLKTVGRGSVMVAAIGFYAALVVAKVMGHYP